MKKKQKQGNVEYQSKPQCEIDTLSDELITVILSKVPTLELGNLRCVCKRWRNIAKVKDSLFRTLHLSHSMSRLNENSLLFLKGKFDDMHLIDLASGREITITTPHVPYLYQYDIIGSCNGLLCLGHKESMKIFVINPFTSEHLLLSPLCTKTTISSWGFGFDFINKIFKVVLVVRALFGTDLELRIFDLHGDKKLYDSHKGRKKAFDFNLLSESPACFFNGRRHWTHKNGVLVNIVSFDLADDQFRMISAPDCLRSGGKFDLFVLRGCLCIIYSEPFATPRLKIWVMKEYGVKGSWVKEVDTRPYIPTRFSFCNESDCMKDHFTLQGLGSLQDGRVLLKCKKRCKKRKSESIILCSHPKCIRFSYINLKRGTFTKGSVIHAASLNWV